MRTKFIVTLLTLTFAVYSQKKPAKTLTFYDKITNINLHNLTGIPIVTTQGAVYGIDGNNGKKIWEFKESGFITGLNALGQSDESSFSEIPLSPFGRFNETIFDIKSGRKVIDNKTNNFKSIIDNKPIPEKKAILFFAKTDKTKAKLFLISIENSKVLWESNIESSKKLEGFMGFGGVSNFIQNNKQVAFVAGKSIFLLDKKDGKVILEKKYDAGKLFFTEDNNSLIVVENKSSSLVGGAIKAGFTMGLSLIGKKVIGKEVISFNTKSGEEVWKKTIKLDEGFVDYQFVDGKLFIIHKDGGILYDYYTGQKVWKKDFKKNKVKSLEKTDKGYLVYYKNKKHLLDNSGKKIWKKSQKVVSNVDFEVDDEEDFTVFEYSSGNLFLTPFRIEYFEKGKEKRIFKINLDNEKDKLVYDEINNSLILLKKKKLYVLNPDKGLLDEQVKKIDFHDYNKIHTVEIRKNGYFITSNWEYVITDFKGKIIKKEHFLQPGEGFRKIKNIGSSVFAMASAQVYTTTDASGKTVTTVSSSANIVNDRNAREGAYISKNGEAYEGLSNALYTPERFNAFKTTKNSAFFYTKKDSEKVLLQIDKDNGDLLEIFKFDVNEPKYKIDKLAKRIYFRNGKEFKIFEYK